MEKKLKIVHIVNDDIGGAGRAAIRISNALKICDVDSIVLVMNKTTNDSMVHSIFKNSLSKYIFKIFRKIFAYKKIKSNKPYNYYVINNYGCNIRKNKYVRNADIINLHWINQNMLSIRDIKWIKKNKKTFWTLHDMWPFTMCCHYTKDCSNYLETCLKCDKLKTSKKNIVKLIKTKKELIQDIQFIGCSRWITNEHNLSMIRSKNDAICINNPIDFEVFNYNTSNFREMNNIALNDIVILFGAMASDSDPRKGISYLYELIAKFKTENYVLIIFGNDSKINIDIGSLRVLSLGRITSDKTLANVYSASNVFVAPSIQENLSNAVMESLSCTTPVVAFNIGGMKDMIVHKENGYLAKNFDSDDLYNGVKFCLDNEVKLRNNSKEIIKSFSFESIGNKYLNAYKNLLEDAHEKIIKEDNNS